MLKSIKLLTILGTRPQIIKAAGLSRQIREHNNLSKFKIKETILHTGQHYDKNMSGSFFEQLQIPEPHINLESSGGTQAEQTANIMMGFEKELLTNPADLVLVVGDVTSTMACAIVAQKLHTRVAHVEAGIRSGDWSMPEEINRLVTDSITNYFFTTSELANKTLRDSGVSSDKIFFVGNTMIDTLLKQRPNFEKPDIWEQLNLEKGKYIVMTLHRPANVDEETILKELISEIVAHSRNHSLVFPVHPRTAKILDNLGIDHPQLHKVPPLSYLEFNYLVENSKAVITDSGGITEETSIMGIPCLTLRDNTERPETIELGTNELVGTNPQNIKPYLNKLFEGTWKKGNEIPYWDGNTATRIIEVLLSLN